MPQYEINWAIGGRQVIQADNPEDARTAATGLIPTGGEWVDVDLIKMD